MLDVAIIGGGVCGCSLLYALSRYKLNIALLEATNDVGVATTKANSAILHAGYDPEPGTLMAKYNVEGARIAKELCKDLDILRRQTGSLVVAFTEEESATVQKLYERGVQNGVEDLRIVQKDELLQMEPQLSKSAICALYAPTAAVVNPWELAFAQAEVAVQNGARVLLSSSVTAITKKDGYFEIEYSAENGEKTAGGTLQARFVVNAAGIHAADVAQMAGAADFTITPNRGQYFLLDKNQGQMARHVIFQCPGPEGKGVLVAPTVHGNLIVGPNAEDAGDTGNTADGLSFVRKMAVKSVPDINFRQSIRNFAGLRAVANAPDFIVGESPLVKGFFNMAGIKSPGLTAAPAIAQDITRMLGKAGLALTEKPEYIKTRKVRRFAHMSETPRAQLIKENPLYGQIVCRCETVTEGEIVDALHRPLPPRSVDAVKRRCTPGMGRCQGGFCGPRVQAIIARELGIPQCDVPLDRDGMDIVLGRTKDENWQKGGNCND